MTTLYNNARHHLDNLAKEYEAVLQVLTDSQRECSELKKDANTWGGCVETFKEQLAAFRENAEYWEREFNSAKTCADVYEKHLDDEIDNLNDQLFRADEELAKERTAHAITKSTADPRKSIAAHDRDIYKQRWKDEQEVSRLLRVEMNRIKYLTEAAVRG